MGDFIASVQYGREGHEISENTASHRPFSSRSHHAVHGIHGAAEKSEYTHVLRQEMRSRLSNIELGSLRCGCMHSLLGVFMEVCGV